MDTLKEHRLDSGTRSNVRRAARAKQHMPLGPSAGQVLPRPQRATATQSVYVTGLGQGDRGPTIALGVMELMARQNDRTAVFRPLTRRRSDPVVELLRNHCRLEQSNEQAYGLSYEEAAVLQAERGSEELIGVLVDRFRELKRQYGAVLVLGDDSESSGVPDPFALNARLANEFAASLLPVISPPAAGAGAVAATVRNTHRAVTNLGCNVLAVIVNGVANRDEYEVRLRLADRSDVPVYVIPEATVAPDAVPGLNPFTAYVDTSELAGRIGLHSPAAVTPMTFQRQLLERARGQENTAGALAETRRSPAGDTLQDIVLPEGTEERVLRAAEVLLHRGVCHLTLLGTRDAIHERVADLGLDLGLHPERSGSHGARVRIIDPATSPLRDHFAERYAEIRKHKGMTVARAHEVVADAGYFGTLLVQEGLAHGMVSGAVHSTAETIRPALEIVRTAPGAAMVSSVFFMCLKDRVLVYGDCAVNPRPDAEQLADIAIQSADTAARFGVEPRIALLSYSSGSSGSGTDVEKVRRATELVRRRRPDLPVEGPIQYDAAVEPAVARAKLPGSPVAGRATVLIFPDLNAGNIAYKAVQRSAGAVAVGPVLQGLHRPVNDLSRGALVTDIVNTVAITAIQAQRTNLSVIAGGRQS